MYKLKSFLDFFAILKVFNKAHMIYSWGLVENGQSKKLDVHGKNPYQGKFCLLYCQLGNHLMVTKNVPLLLMFETYSPVAVEGTTHKLQHHNSKRRVDTSRPPIHTVQSSTPTLVRGISTTNIPARV